MRVFHTVLDVVSFTKASICWDSVLKFYYFTTLFQRVKSFLNKTFCGFTNFTFMEKVLISIKNTV
jgi:hypothetical protein